MWIRLYVLCFLVGIFSSSAAAQAAVLDVSGLITKSIRYAEEKNKIALQNRFFREQQQADAATGEINKGFGNKVKGNIDILDPNESGSMDAAHKAYLNKRELREALGSKTAYDTYLDRVKVWNAQVEVYRAKVIETSEYANANELSLLEWQKIHGSYRLSLAQISVAKAVAANEQSEIILSLTRERNRLRGEILERKNLTRDISSSTK